MYLQTRSIPASIIQIFPAVTHRFISSVNVEEKYLWYTEIVRFYLLLRQRKI